MIGLPADLVLRWALIAALALAALTVLALLQVLALAHRGRRMSERRRALEEHWRPALARAGAGEDVRPPGTVPGGRESLWLMLLFTRTLQALRGAGRARLQALAREAGLHDRALEMLDSRSIQRQLVALSCLRELAEPSHWAPVMARVESRNRAVAMAAARVLVALDSHRAMHDLLPGMLAAGTWSTGQLHEICGQAGAAAVTPVLAGIVSGDAGQARERALPLLRLALPTELAHWARRTLDASPNTEPGTAAGAALGVLRRLADPRDRDRIMPWLAARDPVVRLQAVRAVGRLSGPQDAPRLEAALGDADWAVRQAAADALVRLPGVDPERLQDRAEQLHDRYARDALVRALSELAP